METEGLITVAQDPRPAPEDKCNEGKDRESERHSYVQDV